MKIAREKQLITCEGFSIRLTSDFSSEIVKKRIQWKDIKY